MKKKIKYLMQAATIAALTVPALVMAQTPYGISDPSQTAAGSNNGSFDPSAGGSTGLPAGSIHNIVVNIMKWFLELVGVVGVIGFCIAGVLYLTSAGDDTRIEQAKKAMLYSIIGVIVAILGVVILYAASGMLSAQSQF